MKKLILILLLGILLVQQISSLTVQINVRPEFHIGETLEFDYRIISSLNEKIIYTPYIYCPKIAMPFLEAKEKDILANQPIIKTFSGDVVESNFESQTCTAYIQILNPVEQLISKNFSIVTLPTFSFDIKLDKKIFLKGERINLDYSANVKNPSISATLIYPNKNKKQINLPYSFTAKQIGTYTLEIMSSKKNYKTITKKIYFGVVEKEARFSAVGTIKSKKGFFSRAWSKLTGKVVDLFS